MNRPETSSETPTPEQLEEWRERDPSTFRYYMGALAINEAQAATIEKKDEKIRRLEHDSVVKTFLNRSGFEERIYDTELEPNLEEELKGGACGIVLMDVRFLKYINDEFTRKRGDIFLGAAGDKIENTLDHLIRTRVREVQEELRRSGSPNADIRVRYGGDEFILLIQYVTPENLEKVTDRLRQEFSISKALTDSEEHGGIPVAANTVAVHASAISAEERQALSGLEILEKLVNSLDEPHELAKKEQYDEMWEIVAQKLDLEVGERPTDDRDVAGKFIRYCCPSFYRDAQQRLGGSQT